MTAIELDSFLSKFKQLCSSGLDAHLEAGSHAGQAWVSLRVGLGQLPKSHECHRQRKNGPARQKRRERREAARKVSNDIGHENDQPVIDEVVAEEATLETEKVAQTQTAKEKDTHKDTESSAENAEPVIISVANDVIDEIEMSEMEPSEEEELVMIFGEHSCEEGSFDHKQFFGEIKRRLEPLVSFFHYDGTYWKEKENATGFYQTVRLKQGIYRRDLRNLENWPVRTKILEIRKQEESYLRPW